MTPRLLKQFGLLMAGVLSLFFGLLLPFFLHRPLPLLPWGLAILFLSCAMLRPTWLGPVYTLWMKIGHGLGEINTCLLLSIIFFSLITPMGMILRLCRYDPLNKQCQSHLSSYRKPLSSQPIQHMERPF